MITVVLSLASLNPIYLDNTLKRLNLDCKKTIVFNIGHQPTLEELPVFVKKRENNMIDEVGYACYDVKMRDDERRAKFEFFGNFLKITGDRRAVYATPYDDHLVYADICSYETTDDIESMIIDSYTPWHASPESLFINAISNLYDWESVTDDDVHNVAVKDAMCKALQMADELDRNSLLFKAWCRDALTLGDYYNLWVGLFRCEGEDCLYAFRESRNPEYLKILNTIKSIINTQK